MIQIIKTTGSFKGRPMHRTPYGGRYRTTAGICEDITIMNMWGLHDTIILKFSPVVEKATPTSMGWALDIGKFMDG